MRRSFEQSRDDIIKAGNRLDTLRLAPATSGNYSMRLSDEEMAITVSGAHKGHLATDQIMRADLNGNALEGKTPSAETLLHCAIYKLYPQANAILHTHSIANTVLTRILTVQDTLSLSGYEMLKAYDGIDTHDTSVKLPIFENTQDIRSLSAEVDMRLKQSPKTPVFLIRSHGIYGWGNDMPAALRVIEATEMMLECEMHERQIQNAAQATK